MSSAPIRTRPTNSTDDPSASVVPAGSLFDEDDGLDQPTRAAGLAVEEVRAFFAGAEARDRAAPISDLDFEDIPTRMGELPLSSDAPTPALGIDIAILEPVREQREPAREERGDPTPLPETGVRRKQGALEITPIATQMPEARAANEPHGAALAARSSAGPLSRAAMWLSSVVSRMRRWIGR